MNKFTLFSLGYYFLNSNYLTGKYNVLYPRKKQIIFNPTNHYIYNNTLILNFHQEHKKYYYLNFFNHNHSILLHNKYNDSDYIILQKKII